MPTEKIKAAREAQAARYAALKGAKTKGKEPFLSKLLYFIASLFLVGGFMMCNSIWVSTDEPGASVNRLIALSALGSGIMFFALLAAAGSALGYLKTIAENSDQ